MFANVDWAKVFLPATPILEIMARGSIIFWNYTLDWLGYHFPAFQRFVHPPPLPLVKDGTMLRRNMRRDRRIVVSSASSSTLPATTCMPGIDSKDQGDYLRLFFLREALDCLRLALALAAALPALLLDLLPGKSGNGAGGMNSNFGRGVSRSVRKPNVI